MASIFKGAINFGLINIPVSLNLAAKKESVSFRMLHKGCNAPVEYKRVCTKCGKEVALKDIVKGFEYEKGKYVIVDEDEFAGLPKGGGKYVQILDFIKLSEVDPIYFEKPYFLYPEKNGEKAYNLLRIAMENSKRIAVGKIYIRDKENLCVIRVYNGTLALSTMYYPSEIREVKSVDSSKSKPTADELKMATQLIENLTAKFSAEKYVSEYRQELTKLINSKISKKQTVSVPKGGKIVAGDGLADLFKSLQASVAATNKKKKKTA